MSFSFKAKSVSFPSKSDEPSGLPRSAIAENDCGQVRASTKHSDCSNICLQQRKSTVSWQLTGFGWRGMGFFLSIFSLTNPLEGLIFKIALE